MKDVKYDPEFHDALSKLHWRENHGYMRNWYRDGGKTKTRSMHRHIWELAGNEPVEMLDHINRDRKDNRLCNLRPASPTLNALNTNSANVYWNAGKGKAKNPWTASIRYKGKDWHFGCYATKEHALSVVQENKQRLIDYEEKLSQGIAAEFPDLITHRYGGFDNDALRDLVARGAYMDELMEALGATAPTIRKRAKELGIVISKRKLGRPKFIGPRKPKDRVMVADRHEENARYWNKRKHDPDFISRRKEKNRLAQKRYREKKKLRDTDDEEIKRNRREPDERHVYDPNFDFFGS